MDPSMVIQSQLLATKFFVPVASGTLISRPRLTSLLDESLKYPLTLVSAAAGFGKTTLLASWAQSLPASQALVAWLSLDEEDNDPQLFWTYVLSALDQRQPEHFTSLFKSLQSPQPPPLKHILTALSNLLLESSEHIVLILDDYHLITEQQVHTTLSYLIEHLPPQCHIILATRVDPPLPLSQMRAHQHLLEVRTTQVRCTVAETKTFFQQVMGIHLPEPMIQEVTARTEGWLVGLHLLALSLRGPINPAKLLQEVSGDQRYILDFLTEEILRRQSQDMQTFLLSTSILGRLTASLCDRVMQQTASQQMLERLEQANLFVVSLDSNRQWYRYHALFAQALHYRLEQTQPDQVPLLHHRASLWYAEHDQMTEAILHALHAQEWQWAADLIEQKLLPLVSETWRASLHEIVQMRDWLKQLPVDVVHARPQLCLASALLLLMVTPSPMVEGWLDVAEATLSTSLRIQTDEDSASPVTLQQDLLGAVIGLRAVLRMYEGDEEASLELSQRAFALFSPDNALFRAQLLRNQLQLFYISSLNNAETAFENGLQGIALARAAGESSLVISSIGSLAMHMIGAGKLHETQQLILQARLLGAPLEKPLLPDLSQAELLREWNQLDEARSLAEEALLLCEQSASIVALAYLLYGYMVLLRIALSQGDLEAARSALQQFEGLGMNMNQPLYHLIRSLFTIIDQVRLWLACGELDHATDWAEILDMSKRHGTPFAREREEVACARVLLATAQPTLALQRLEPVQQRAAQGQRWGHVIEIRLLQALSHQMLHEEMQALSALSEAIRLAEPEGYIRSFVDEGVPMAALLSRLREQQRETGPTPYLDTLLATFPKENTAKTHLPKHSK